MTDAVQKLKQWVSESERIVFFGGAGVSTESGIPDFRSTDGLYHQQYDYPPETILSHTSHTILQYMGICIQYTYPYHLEITVPPFLSSNRTFLLLRDCF